ncbi:telomerase-binding protein EST1A-like isoform X2 [Thalassophryne amazonica]|uniref:telomerase-binding protein EST1A-like isoform X2 n=1 Tax=Thalassophryne amazonica TaxID=390379 RepID=UPI0014714722|nr:telomerase-binding protein EST1A-like isoform X2 [Thalassophryne amazonica]
MANELDRVRISAAELRADVSNSVNSELQEEDQQEHQGHQQHRRREGKRPDLQRYQPAAGHGRRHRDSEEGETSGSGLCDDNIALLSEHNPPQSSEKMAISDTVSDMKECMSGGMGTNQSDDARLRGDGSNAQHSRNNSSAQAKTKELHEKDFVENEREPQELVGSAKQTKKTRKPDREFYQPGSRRNTQGKDCGTSKQQDKPPPRKHLQKSEPVSQSRTGENEGNTMLLKNGGKNNLRKFHNGKLSKMSDASQKQGSTHEEKPPLPSQTSLEKLTSKMDKLSVKGKAKVSSVSQDDDEVVCRKWETNTNKSSQGGGTKDDEDKVVKKGERGNRRIRGGEKEKERNLDSRRGEAEVGSGAKNDQKTTEKGRGTRPPDIGRENKPGKTKEMKQVTGRENRRGKGDSNNNRSQENEKGNKMDRNVDGLVERRNKSNVKITTPTSKRYSKSDIRRSRNRTYSSSSASSAASLDGPGPGVDGQSIKWPRSNPRHNDKEKTVESRGGRRGDSHNWSTNGESSTESLDGSEMSDIAEDKRRRRRDCEQQLSTDRLRGERKRPKGCSSASRGILKVSSERQSGTSSCDDAQRCKQGLSPRGRGGGILVLPAHTDICDSPELGQRLLFGRSRGGTPSRGRGGRGGGVRRLWDPNNPDQKPALTNAPSSQHSYLQQPTYLHTGTGYGQLHFLDTDDEVAGSPPLPLGEYFQSQQQQAAAMTYYKFQNSDNPYSYPVPTSNTQNPNSISNQRYPYPYHMGPYQMSHPNGMYSGTNVGQFSDGYRGTGYSHPGATGVLTFEEVEQHARGELGRLLRAADTQEHQLSNLLSRDHLSADGLDRMAQLRAELLVLYEQAILTDIEFSDTQSVDQALWKNVFYQVIERFRQLLKDSASDNMASMRNMLLTLLDEGAVFFDALLQKLQTVYHFKLEDYMDGMAIRTRPLSKTVKYALISAQRCMICQGDIARYREQASDSNNYGKARR